MKFDDCKIPDVLLAARLQAEADITMDEIKEAGYGSPYLMQLNDQQEEKAKRNRGYD